MTYRELWQMFIDSPNEKMDDDVTVYDPLQDEYFPITGLRTCNDGVLDDGHLFLEMAK